MKNLKDSKKAILILVALAVIFLAGGVIYITQKNTTSTDRAANKPKNPFTETSASNPEKPIGILTMDDADYKSGDLYLNNHYYQVFGGKKKRIYESSPMWGTTNNISNMQTAYYIKEEDNYLIKIWDLEKSSSRDVYEFKAQDYNFQINSLFISSDNKNLYVVLTFEDKDYKSKRQDPDFSLADIILNTELYRIKLNTGNIEKLHSQKTNLETYSIRYVSNDILVMSLYSTEADWRYLGFFDVNKGEFVKKLEDSSDFISSLSPNKRFFAYDTKLFSKVGDFDPSGIKLIDMDTLKDITPDFISNYDFDIQRVSNTAQNHSARSVYYGLQWGTDNSSLYTIKETAEYEKVSAKFKLCKIDFASEKLTSVFDIPTDLESPSLLGIYKDSYLIRGYTNDLDQIWNYPKGILLAEDSEFSSPKVVAVPSN